MKHVILALICAFSLGLSWLVFFDEDSNCDILLERSAASLRAGYYAETLDHLRAFYAEPDCQDEGIKEASWMAARARLKVPELNGRERRQHFAILSTLSGRSMPVEAHEALMEAKLMAGAYSEVLEHYESHSSVLTGTKASMLALTAARALGQRVHEEIHLASALSGPGALFQKAYLRRIYDLDPADEDLFYLPLVDALLRGQSPPRDALKIIEALSETEQLFIARLLRAGNFQDLAVTIFLEQEELSADVADFHVRALWSSGRYDELSTLGERLSDAVGPSAYLYICEAGLVVGTQQDCLELFDPADMSRRYGAHYVEIWVSLLTARTAGVSGYLDAIDSLEKLARFDRPSPLQESLLESLYTAIGEPDLAALAAHRAQQMAAGEHPGEWEAQTGLQEYRSALNAGELFSSEDIKAAKALSPVEGVVWRQVEAASLAGVQSDQQQAKAIQRHREVIDKVGETSDSYSLSLLKLAKNYAYFGDKVAAREAIVRAVNKRPDVLPLAYSVSLGFFQPDVGLFDANDLVGLWGTLAWKEAAISGDEAASAIAANRFSLLLRLGLNTGDEALILSSCQRVTQLVGQIPQCQNEGTRGAGG